MSAALNFPEDHEDHDDHKNPVLGEPNLLPAHIKSDAHAPGGGQDQTPPPAGTLALPNCSPLAGAPDFAGDHTRRDSHESAVSGDQDHLSGHHDHDAQFVIAAEVPTSPPGHDEAAFQTERAGRGPILADPFLGLMAATVTDLEELRKGLANRHRYLTGQWFDENGENPIGLNLPKDHPQVKVIRAILESIGGVETSKLVKGEIKVDKKYGDGGIEHEAVLQLGRAVRKHALWKAWGVHQKGIGEKQFARLLAAIGDPYWNDLHNCPRRVSSLWKYCGQDVVNGMAPKMARGQRVTWSPEAKKRIWLIAGQCLIAQDHYADVYYRAKEKYVDSKHLNTCPQCGPKGHPALPGSDLNGKHKHQRAIRIVSKEILKDLWCAAKEIHETDTTLPARVDPPPRRKPPKAD